MSLRSRILALFEDSAFRAPVLKLLSGTGLAFVVAYLASFVLMRIYADEFWGVADYVIAWVSILAPVASLRYEDALMLPKDDRKSAHAYLLSVGFTVLFCVIAFLLLAYSDALSGFFEAKGAGVWILLLPAALLANRLAKINELWLSRQEAFGRMSVSQVVQSSSTVSWRLASGAMGPGPGGLIWGYVVGFSLASLSMISRVWSTLKSSLKSAPTWTEIRDVAKRYRRFPQFTMPATLISGLITRLPVLYIPEVFGMAVTGQYTRAFAILFLPLSMIGASVAHVFFVRAVEANRSGTLPDFSSNVHARLVLIGMWPTAVLMVAGGDIFATLFGEVWRESAHFLRYVGPWILLTAVASPMTRLFDVLEKQRHEFAITAASLVVIGGALFWGSQSQDIHETLLFLGIGGVGVRSFQIAWLLRLAQCGIGAVVRPYVRYGLIALPFLAMTYAASTMEMPWFTTVVGTVAGLLFLGFVLKREKLY